ncbi:hypothetical protein HMPREF9984_04041, partial [Staphylococcus epidermidis NIHLM037]
RRIFNNEKNTLQLQLQLQESLLSLLHTMTHKQQNKIIMGTILTTLIHIAILTQSMLKVTTTTLGKVTGVQIV